MRPSLVLKADKTRTVWLFRIKETVPRPLQTYDKTLWRNPSTGRPGSVRQPAREEWLLRCWEWVLRQRYYWIIVFVSMFLCMVVLLIGGWRPLRKRQVKVMEGEEEEEESEDELAENPNDSPTLAHKKAEWREIRSRVFFDPYDDIDDDEWDKEQDTLTRITIQQDKRAERRAVFAFLWFGALVGGWSGMGGYYVFSRPWKNWNDLLFAGVWMAVWGCFVSEVGCLVAIFGLREKRVDFPPAMKPRGGWGSRLFKLIEVKYPVLRERRVSGILQYMMKLFRRWVLAEGRQRANERLMLYNFCLDIRENIEYAMAERRETRNTDRVFAEIAVQGKMMGEFCESPLEDIAACRDAIGDDRLPMAERVIGRPEGGRRRETRQRQTGTEVESTIRRVTRSMAKEMEGEISSETISDTTVVDDGNKELARSRARGRNVWSTM